MESMILNLLLVLLVAWLAGQLANRMGYPSVLGELLAGIVLGPPLLGLLQGSEALAVLAEVGIILMMVYIGMEIDPKELGKASKAGLLAALGGFITPFVLCYLAIIWAGGSIMAAIFVGVAAGVTSLATKSRILVDLQLLDTRIAHVLMAGALIADTFSLVIFAGIIGVAEAGDVDAAGLVLVAIKAIVFFAVAAVIGLKVRPRLLPWLTKRIELGGTSLFTLVLLIALAYAEMAELAGMHGILGAFLAGLFLRESALGRTRAKELMHLVRDASIGFLAPVFFVTAGFAVSLDIFTESLGLLVLVVVLATLGKIVGTALFYLPTGLGWREGVTVGAGMNGRGAVEIIIAQIGLTMGLITQEIFSILVFMAIATTATVPVFLKWGTEWLRRRGELVRSDQQRSGVVIVGAGPLARKIAKVLQRSQPVWLIDRNSDHCAAAQADGLEALQGNALDEETLSNVHAAEARYLLALTPNAEVNTLVARMARDVFHVPEVQVMNSGSAGHEALVEHLGLSTLFAGEVDVAEWDYHVDHGTAEQNRVPLAREMTTETLFRELTRELSSLPLAIERDETYLPFSSSVTLEEGDRIITLQEVEVVPHTFDRFDRLIADAPVLDVDRALDRDAFFELATSVLAPRLELEPKDLIERLKAREVIGSTVFLPGLAIPHVVFERDVPFEILLARSREGIAFPGEEERIHTVFLMVGSAEDRTFHLRALSAIAQTIQTTAFERDWLLAPNAEALRKLVLHAPRRRFSQPSASAEPRDQT